MMTSSLKILSILVSLLGFGVFGYSLSQQTKIQLSINQSMLALNQYVSETTPIVAQTGAKLAPLTGTTSSLSQILASEQQTVTDLQSMNNELVTIGTTEGKILSGMKGLTGATVNVGQSIASAGAVTNGVLLASEASAQGASAEAQDLGELNSQTATTVSQLHQLNTKLAALKLLP